MRNHQEFRCACEFMYIRFADSDGPADDDDDGKMLMLMMKMLLKIYFAKDTYVLVVDFFLLSFLIAQVDLDL